MPPFNINALDHVAIRVKDMDLSIAWYARVLGLKRYQLEQWGAFPIFMFAGKTGVAIFPANVNDEQLNPNSKNTKIDHFAFNVSNEDFKIAQVHFKTIGESFQFQDHHYFHSVYLKDPDQHTVELTTIVVDEASFYE